MNIYKNLSSFIAEEKNLDLSKQLKKHIKDQLKVFDSEFAADDENSLIILETGERLYELFEKYPHLEKIRPENSSSIDNYINQVFVTAPNGTGVSVYLPIDPPVRCGNEAVMEYRAKYLEGSGPRI